MTLMLDSRFAHALLLLWLLPCALYDWHQRRIPNWVTLPALPLALLWATDRGNLSLTLLVLAATFLAFQRGMMGGADGKMATVQAAFFPAALAVTGFLLAGTFLYLQVRQQAHNRLPAGPWFLAGTALAALLIPLIETLSP